LHYYSETLQCTVQVVYWNASLLKTPRGPSLQLYS